jgi:hypothetical protein
MFQNSEIIQMLDNKNPKTRVKGISALVSIDRQGEFI